MASLAVQAAQKAVEMAKIDPKDIGLLLVANSGGSDKDKIMPTTDTQVASEIGATLAAGYTFNAACAGLVYGLIAADGLMKVPPKKKYGVAIGSETLTKRLTSGRWGADVLFGSGASAVVFENVQSEDCLWLPYMAGDCSGDKTKRVIYGHRDPLIMAAGHDKRIFVEAVEAFTAVQLQCLCKDGNPDNGFHVPLDQLVAIYLHQANKRIVDASVERVQKVVPGYNTQSRPAFNRIRSNIDRMANTSSASVGIMLDEDVRAGLVGLEDTILLVGVGIGYHVGGILMGGRSPKGF